MFYVHEGIKKIIIFYYTICTFKENYTHANIQTHIQLNVEEKIKRILF